MALNTPTPWLIAYDIADKRRLSRLHRFLRRHALPVQFSVFMIRATPGRIGNLVQSIQSLIEQREDDVRVYRIPEPAWMTVQGRIMLPSDVLLMAHGAELAATRRRDT